MRTHPTRVTIGMPVYNASAMLAEAIESLLAQTYGDFRVIVSDNASTDDTESIGREYAARDPRISYVRQEVNHGSAWNFNEVFKLSDSEYFKWAAYDDLCHPTYLQRCVEVLDQHPDVLWVHSRSRHIDASGKLLLGDDTPEVSYVRLPQDEFERASNEPPTRDAHRPSDRFRAVLLGRDGCLDSYGLIRAAVLHKTQLFQPSFGSEKVLMAELGLWGRYYEIPEALFFARIHPAAVGNQKTGQLQRKFINPLACGRWQLPRLQLLLGYASAVRRSDVGLAEKARSYAAIARYLFQVHKWKTVILSGLTGGGLSGAYPAVSSTQRAPKGC